MLIMIKYKKGLTLLELTIVVIIVGLLLTAFANFWKGVDRDFIKAQTCANEISSKLSSIVNWALLQKWVFINSQWIYPTSHWIEFYPTWFQYRIYSWDTPILVDEMLTTGLNYGVDNNCYGNGYRVKIGVVSWGKEAPIGINYQDALNWKIYCDCSSWDRFNYVYKLFYCKGGECKEFYKISTDFRSYGIVWVPCLQFSWWTSCQKRADNKQESFSGCIFTPCY